MRQCNYPGPQRGGEECEGESQQHKDCMAADCASEIGLKFPIVYKLLSGYIKDWSFFVSEDLVISARWINV